MTMFWHTLNRLLGIPWKIHLSLRDQPTPASRLHLLRSQPDMGETVKSSEVPFAIPPAEEYMAPAENPLFLWLICHHVFSLFSHKSLRRVSEWGCFICSLSFCHDFSQRTMSAAITCLTPSIVQALWTNASPGSSAQSTGVSARWS